MNLINFRKGHFHRTSDDIFGYNLTGNEFIVYSVLLLHMNNKTRTSKPSIDLIGRISGLSDKTTCKCIKSIAKKNVIAIERTEEHNTYYILDLKDCSNIIKKHRIDSKVCTRVAKEKRVQRRKHKINNGVSVDIKEKVSGRNYRTCPEDSSKSVRKKLPCNHTKMNHKNIPKEPKEEISHNDLFDQFKSVYSIKLVNEKLTKILWDKLTTKDHKDILKHIPLYIKSVDDTKYLCKSTNYLKNRKWESDENGLMVLDPILQKINEIAHRFKLPDNEKNILRDYVTTKYQNDALRFLNINRNIPSYLFAIKSSVIKKKTQSTTLNNDIRADNTSTEKQKKLTIEKFNEKGLTISTNDIILSKEEKIYPNGINKTENFRS